MFGNNISEKPTVIFILMLVGGIFITMYSIIVY